MRRIPILCVNAVFIGSPTYTHHDIMVKTLAADKDVFCEKPIAETLEDTKKCYDIAKANGRKLFAAFNRRFDPAYRGLKERVRKGEVGHVQILKVTTRDSPPPSINYLKHSGLIKVENERPCHSTEALIGREGLNQTPIYYSFPSRYKLAYTLELEHFLDVIQSLIKVENERPCHSTEALIGREGLNQTPIYYSFPSRYKLAYTLELEHFLDVIQSLIKVENERPCHSTEALIGREGLNQTPIYYSFPSRYKLAYTLELEHFLDVIQSKTK